MKNPLNLAIVTVLGPSSNLELFRLDELTEREATGQALEKILAQGRAEATRLRDEAEACLVQAKEEASAILAACRITASQVVQEARTSAAKEAVEWLCSELEMERLIAKEICQRWRHLTAQVLEELLGQQDQNGLLLRRIERRVAELLPTGRLQLQLPLNAMAAAEELWRNVDEVVLIASSSLSEGQAILDNGLVRIHLDAPEQQAELLTRFVGAPVKRQQA